MVDEQIERFSSNYGTKVLQHFLKLRKVIFANLPDILEQPDLPAKMISYTYGQKYSELICVIIPSKKGLKLGFNRGTELQDPKKLLAGTAKISRYVEITSEELINSEDLKKLIESAFQIYTQLKNKLK